MEDQYDIRALYIQSSRKGLLSRLMWPRGRRHPFLALVQNDTKILRELHFSSRDANNKAIEAGDTRPLNLIALAAERIGLGAAFVKAVESIGLGDHLIRLKDVHFPRSRRTLASVGEYGRVHGAPKEILNHWDKAVQHAKAIGEARLPFTSIGFQALHSHNCHGGTKTVIMMLGPEFSAMAQAMAHEPGATVEKRLGQTAGAGQAEPLARQPS